MDINALLNHTKFPFGNENRLCAAIYSLAFKNMSIRLHGIQE